jgi:hypothetical protein
VWKGFWTCERGEEDVICKHREEREHPLCPRRCDGVGRVVDVCVGVCASGKVAKCDPAMGRWRSVE